MERCVCVCDGGVCMCVLWRSVCICDGDVCEMEGCVCDGGVRV